MIRVAVKSNFVSSAFEKEVVPQTFRDVKQRFCVGPEEANVFIQQPVLMARCELLCLS